MLSAAVIHSTSNAILILAVLLSGVSPPLWGPLAFCRDDRKMHHLLLPDFPAQEYSTWAFLVIILSKEKTNKPKWSQIAKGRGMCARFRMQAPPAIYIYRWCEEAPTASMLS